MESKNRIYSEYGRLLTRKPRRKEGHDYASVADYFITLCLKNRAHILSSVHNGKVFHSDIGNMMSREWYKLPIQYSGIKLHNFIVMPDHLHGIIEIVDPNNKVTISEMMANYKSITTCHYSTGVHNAGWPRYQKKLWAYSFWDIILKDAEAFKNCAQYIDSNPLRW
jgi:REP element-mobilizing transposase RayT